MSEQRSTITNRKKTNHLPLLVTNDISEISKHSRPHMQSSPPHLSNLGTTGHFSLVSRSDGFDAIISGVSFLTASSTKSLVPIGTPRITVLLAARGINRS
jgi:hypothetical protein